MAADAMVIGAGLIGSSIAWRLAQAGMKVVLLDAGRMGGEASWAGAGMLAPGGEFREASPWSAFGLESLRLYPAFVSELEVETGRRIDYRRNGAVEVASTAAELADLERRAAAQRAMGIPSQAATPSDFGLPEVGAAGARFYPEDALVSPRDLLDALRDALRSVELRECVRVDRLEARGSGVRARTAAGHLDAPVAVLAAGAWSSAIDVTVEGRPRPIPEVYPVRGHLAGYDFPLGTLGPILRHGHTYLLQRSSGFLIAGTSSEECGFDRRIDPAAVEDLQARAGRLLPALQGRTPVEVWTGFRPASRRGVPVIERAGEAPLWLAYGHYRNGILLAPATCRRVAAEILGQSPDA